MRQTFSVPEGFLRTRLAQRIVHYRSKIFSQLCFFFSSFCSIGHLFLPSVFVSVHLSCVLLLILQSATFYVFVLYFYLCLFPSFYLFSFLFLSVGISPRTHHTAMLSHRLYISGPWWYYVIFLSNIIAQYLNMLSVYIDSETSPSHTFVFGDESWPLVIAVVNVTQVSLLPATHINMKNEYPVTRSHCWFSETIAWKIGSVCIIIIIIIIGWLINIMHISVAVTWMKNCDKCYYSTLVINVHAARRWKWNYDLWTFGSRLSRAHSHGLSWWVGEEICERSPRSLLCSVSPPCRLLLVCV